MDVPKEFQDLLRKYIQCNIIQALDTLVGLEIVQLLNNVIKTLICIKVILKFEIVLVHLLVIRRLGFLNLATILEHMNLATVVA